MNYFPESISPKPMNPEIKRQWLEALRSGEYKQGRGYLRAKAEGGSLYCCLGVLCDLHSKATGETWSKQKGEPYRYRGLNAGLPWCVNNWGDLRYNSMENGHTIEGILADANDSGADFPTIANWIEANL